MHWTLKHYVYYASNLPIPMSVVTLTPGALHKLCGLCSIMVFGLAIPLVLSADQERDTLRRFDAPSTSVYYRDRQITAQASRFDLSAPAYIREIGLWLGGAGTGTVRVLVYGNEAGMPAPLLGAQGKSFIVSKKHPGVERVALSIEDGVFIGAPQFFVVVQDLAPSIVLLCDQRPKRAACGFVDETWMYQLIRKQDGRWHHGRYGFAIEAIVDYPTHTPPGYLANVTLDVGFDGKHSGNNSIAWGDYDGDGFHDVMVGGVLYRNIAGSRFESVLNLAAAVDGDSITAHFFFDIDNDADLDVLLLGIRRDDVVRNALLINDEITGFRHISLELPSVIRPSTACFSDADLDGFVDVFIGQASLDSTTSNAVLLLNNQRSGLREVSNAFVQKSPVIGAQWVDIDFDGDPDLVAHSSVAGEVVWTNDGNGGFAADPREDRHPIDAPAHSKPGDVGDADEDLSYDILAPRDASARTFEALSHHGRELALASDFLFGNEYRHWSGGATWADVNNDGRLDVLVTSASRCRFASLFVQEPSGRFVDASFEYGLFRAPIGTDAVWIDFNNDGKLDLATFRDSAFQLFQNTAHLLGRSFALDVTGGTSPSTVTNVAGTAHVGQRRIMRFVASGRGGLMQGPSVLHFGYEEGTIDSISIRWGGPYDRSTHLDPSPLSSIHRFHLSTASNAPIARDQIRLDVTPNPFAAALAFRFTLNAAAAVKIEVFASDGSLVSVAAEGQMLQGTHDVRWQPIDFNGRPLPHGTYIYRVNINGAVYTGRAVHIQ